MNFPIKLGPNLSQTEFIKQKMLCSKTTEIVPNFKNKYMRMNSCDQKIAIQSTIQKKLLMMTFQVS